MSLDVFAVAASHCVFGGFVWLLVDARYKARERGRQATRAELRSWLDGLDEGRYGLDHPGWGTLAEAAGLGAPVDASGLERDMVAERNRRAASSFEDGLIIDLREPKGGAS